MGDCNPGLAVFFCVDAYLRVSSKNQGWFFFCRPKNESSLLLEAHTKSRAARQQDGTLRAPH